MKRIILVIFVGILIWTLGCTIDKGKGTFYVDAEVTSIGNTMISVKYKIGDTIVFDDIVMKDNMGILAMIKDTNPKTIPLKIYIEFFTSDEPKKEGFLKYYYGANLLSESRSFEVDALVLVAKENIDIFSWEYRDSDVVKEDAKQKSLEPAPAVTSSKSKTGTTTKPPVKDEKL